MPVKLGGANALDHFRYGGKQYGYYSLARIAKLFGFAVDSLPYSARLLLENVVRHHLREDMPTALTEQVAMLTAGKQVSGALSLRVERLLLPDSSGLPALQDLVAMRDAVARRGHDPRGVAPAIPVDLVVDHSLIVDRFGVSNAFAFNLEREYERNAERYAFLKWCEGQFPLFKVYPPGTGICHQVNLEHRAPVVMTSERDGETLAYPDFVVGSDSHTPMINGLGVLGWGVGGIENVIAMLGQPYVIPMPEFVGVRLVGALRPGLITTDLALTVAERLREAKVVGSMVEFFGSGVASLAVAERATIANMAPEYGATVALFPIDNRTIDFLTLTRSKEHAAFVEAYCRANDLYAESNVHELQFSRVLEIDLSKVERSIAGPKRPYDRMDLQDVGKDFRRRLDLPLTEDGFDAADGDIRLSVTTPRGQSDMGHGSIAVAAITSCTNTSNPIAMLAAGLLARNAVARGLSIPPHIKTSLAPGSRAVTRYLDDANLLEPLQDLGFFIVGYGCTTCAGKSGPLEPAIAHAIEENNLVTASVLSGNRNFEGRIHRLVRANYICSPPLVVAYALAGRIDIDLSTHPIGYDAKGQAILLGDIWPDQDELSSLLHLADSSQLFKDTYSSAGLSSGTWDEVAAPDGILFPWNPQSSYVIEPPFFSDDSTMAKLASSLSGARVLAAFGDSVTTDHISPGGEIPVHSPAGEYLVSLGVAPGNFNTYVSRRSNHDVILRGTFANIRIKNLILPTREGGWTRHFPTGEIVSIFDAATRYRAGGAPMIILAGKEYGVGSARDWAAKGPKLLGVKAVLAESFERTHRANLVALGIVPLQFAQGEGWRQLGLTGEEEFQIDNIAAAVEAGDDVMVTAQCGSKRTKFRMSAVIMTDSERELLRMGGLLLQTLTRFT